MRMLAFLVVGLLLWSLQCKADSAPIYAETGAFTLIGNNACTGPCGETVTFSFEVGFVVDTDPLDLGQGLKIYRAEIVPGSLSYVATGPLDLAVSCNCVGFGTLASNPYIPFASSDINPFTELDMEVYGRTQRYQQERGDHSLSGMPISINAGIRRVPQTSATWRQLPQDISRPRPFQNLHLRLC
jgi:hypothetical protein